MKAGYIGANYLIMGVSEDEGRLGRGLLQVTVYCTVLIYINQDEISGAKVTRESKNNIHTLENTTRLESQTLDRQKGCCFHQCRRRGEDDEQTQLVLQWNMEESAI